eukprot:NODE_4025_length_717_cov_273.484894.p1 GENE.NODE_4025_length_717_cov_273.484894~~NODE_4025_length_717_cov_273.484894.p1  ORF type:complete len:195 (-),score=55.82 NODE_4025_length_717_cov_273.484894:115-699(-)
MGGVGSDVAALVEDERKGRLADVERIDKAVQSVISRFEAHRRIAAEQLLEHFDRFRAALEPLEPVVVAVDLDVAQSTASGGGLSERVCKLEAQLLAILQAGTFLANEQVDLLLRDLEARQSTVERLAYRMEARINNDGAQGGSSIMPFEGTGRGVVDPSLGFRPLLEGGPLCDCAPLTNRCFSELLDRIQLNSL